MPIYEYKCKECGEHFEVEQSITEDSLTSLPGCSAIDGDHALKKVFSAIGISFKGDGFYKNDSRQSSRSTTSSNSSESSSSDSSSTSDSSSSNGSSTSGSSSSDKGSSDSSSSKTSSSSTGSGASSD